MLIPDHEIARHAAEVLLRAMEAIENPTEQQRRFTGSLRAAMTPKKEKKK